MKKELKKVTYIIMIIAIIFSVISILQSTSKAYSIPSESTFISKLNQLKNTFKHGEYWNKYNAVGYDGTGKKMCPCGSKSIKLCGIINGKDGCPCLCGRYDSGTGRYAWQCMGFAYKMGHECFGVTPYNWTLTEEKSGLGTIYAGDIITYKTKESPIYGHTIFVYKVDGDTIYYADCNATGACQVNWNGKKSYSELKANFKSKRHLSGNTLTGKGTTQPTYSYSNLSGSYYLKNSNNNRYLTVDALKDADKANISTAAYSSTKQKVAISHIGSNNHTLIPACTSRLVNAWSNNPSHNSNVNLYHRDNSNLSSQVWKFEKSGKGYIIHLAYNTNLCLTQVNNNVVVQNRTGAANQIWVLEANVVTKGCSHTYDSGKITKKATASANGVKTYTCTKCKATKTATINKASKISLSATVYTYDGKAKKPVVTVKDSNGKTISNTNYTVSYSNNQNPSKATVKITFKNEYTGTVDKNFDIKIASISGAKIKTQSTKGITLQWNKVSTVTGYEVYMATSKNGSYKKIATIGKNTTTTYTKNSLATGKTYYFKIRAYKTIGKKKYYGSYATTVGTTKTSAPKIKSITAGSKQATVKWSKVNAATGYEVYMATSKNGSYKKVATVTKNSTVSYRKKGLTKRKTYYFKVRTYRKVNGKNVYSAMSNIKVVKVK